MQSVFGEEERPKVVLQVIEALGFGGAQKFLVNLAAGIDHKRYALYVCVLQPDNALKDQIEAFGVPVICFGRLRPSVVEPMKFLRYVYANLRDLVRLCKLWRVDVIQCHLPDAEFLGILAGKRCGCRHILATIHYQPDEPLHRRPHDPRNMLRFLMARLLFRWAHAVVAVSEEIAHNLKKYYHVNSSRLSVIPNGIDTMAFEQTAAAGVLREELNLPPDYRVVAVMARLVPNKGHQYLLMATKELVDHGTQFRVLIVGDGELRRGLEEQARSLGVAKQVLFLGSRADVPGLLALTDVFVLPSIWEGTSLSLLEAMAAAKPVVATDIPGNVGLLEHRHNAFLVPPRDPEALAAAIAFLLADEETARAYGRQAQSTVRARFEISRTISEYERFWGADESSL